MEAVTLNVDAEYKALGDAIGKLIVDIKAKKSVGEITADVLPQLVSVVGGLSSMAADIKKVDNQVYLVKALADALEPVPAA